MITFRQGVVLSLATLIGTFSAHWLAAIAGPWVTGIITAILIAALIFYLIKMKKGADDKDADFDS